MINDKNIGFVGLGNVGSKLANSILISGYNLFIYDLDKKKGKNLIKKGAVFSKSLKHLTNSTTIIITCLPSPKAVSQVIESKEGIKNYVSTKHLWIEMSTTDVKEMIRLANLIKSKGASVLESPVTGGQHRAENGNIAVLVSGFRKVFKRALPILKEIGYEILYCGKIGNASTLKIATNYLASINLLSLGEALMVLRKYGIDLQTAFHAIRISSGNSFVHETETQVILSGSYDVGFTMDLVCKDINLFDQLTKKYNISAELSNLMIKIFEKGKKKLGNRAFSTSIVKILENDCNENLRSSNFPKKLKDFEPRKKGFEVKF